MLDIVVVVVGALATTLSTLTIWLIKENRAAKNRYSTRLDTLVKLQISTTRMTLINTHQVLMERGSVTVHEMTTWHTIYRDYHALGGNGIVDAMTEDINNLKIKG